MMTLRLRPGYLAVLTTLSLSPFATASAQTAADNLPQVQVTGSRANDGYVAPTAVSATKSEAPLRDIPQTINVVPTQVIKDQNALSLQDVLKNVPGLGLSTGDGQRDQVFIRGFTAIGDQFVDGFRDDALYYRDLSNVETVEVIKGPAAVLYGRGSSGGLINRVTKKPGINITDVSVTATSTAGRRAEFDVGRGASDDGVVSWRLTGATERGDGFRAQQFIDRTAIAPSVELRFSADTKLLLQADYLEDRRLMDFGIPSINGRPVAVNPATYYGASNGRDADFVQSRVVSTSAVLSHRINESLSFRNNFRYYDYHLNRNSTNINGRVNEVAGTMSLAHGKFVRDENGWFNQSELTQKLTLGGTKHEILYGVEIGSQSKDAFQYANVPVVGTGTAIPPTSIFNPTLPYVNPNTLGALTSTYGTYDTFGAYLQDTIAFSEQWKALAGLRYDSFKQKSRIVGGSAPGDLSRTDTAYSPRAGLVWQPTETQSYYLSWSRSFQPSGENFALAVNNADLAPENTRNTEVGAKYDFWDNRASATVSVFRLERDNIKVTDPTTNRIVPVGKQRTDGIELTFNADLKQGWKVLAGYAYLNAKITDSVAVDGSTNVPGTANTALNVPIQGKFATLTPKHSANIWLTKDLGSGFTVGGGANAVGSRFANPGNTVSLQGYVTADAMAAYRTAKYEVQFNVNNLFNTGYIISGHGSSPNLSLPGAPRNFALTLRYHM